MDFEGFLSRCRKEWPQFGDRRALARAKYPSNRNLASVLESVPGMATENKLKLLNCAAAALGPDEVYVEVGCYKGASLVGAALGNPAARLFACDNFSQFDGAAQELSATLSAHAAGQVSFFDLDFREFMRLAPWRPARIGAYFYDGGHSFRDQYEGLDYVIPDLADDAVIVVDDTNKREARAANALAACAFPGLRLVLDLRTPRNHHPTWWNGIQVLRYRRDPTAPPGRSPGLGFSVRKLVYDDILLAAKLRRRALRRAVREKLRAGRGR